MFHGSEVKVLSGTKRSLDVSKLRRARYIYYGVDIGFTRVKVSERYERVRPLSDTHISCGRADLETPSLLIYSVFRSHVTLGRDDIGVDVPDTDWDKGPR